MIGMMRHPMSGSYRRQTSRETSRYVCFVTQVEVATSPITKLPGRQAARRVRPPAASPLRRDDRATLSGMTEPTRGGDCAGDAQVSAVNPFNRSAAWPLYLGSDSNFHRFVSFRSCVAFGQHLFGK